MVDASGHNIPDLLEAILKFFPLDTYVFNPVVLMDLVNSDKKKDMEVVLKTSREISQKKLPFVYLVPQHTILKVKFLSKNLILTKTPTFSQVFRPIFLVKSKLSTAKKSLTTTFSRVFHPKKNRQFSREIKVEFLDKK